MALQQLIPRDPIFAEAKTPQLQIESWSNSARTLLVRGYTADALISFNHITNSDRSKATDIIDIPAVPQSLQVSPETAPVRRGECYVRVTLLMGGFPVGVLSSCYLTDSKTISYPPGDMEGFTDGPGLIRLVTGTNPAAGQEISETVPTNARWKLLGFRFYLGCDGTAATRTVVVLVDDGATAILDFLSATDQTASQNRYYYCFPMGFLPAAKGSRIDIPLTLAPIMMEEGFRLVTATSNFQAGDNYGTPQLYVEEWIQE